MRGGKGYESCEEFERDVGLGGSEVSTSDDGRRRAFEKGLFVTAEVVEEILASRAGMVRERRREGLRFSESEPGELVSTDKWF